MSSRGQSFLCVCVLSPHRTPVLFDQGLTLVTPLYLITSLKTHLQTQPPWRLTLPYGFGWAGTIPPSQLSSDGVPVFEEERGAPS